MKDIKKVRRYSKEDLVGLVKTVGYDEISNFALSNHANDPRYSYEVRQIVSFVNIMIERIDATEPPMDGTLVSVGPPNFSNELMEAYKKGWS